MATGAPQEKLMAMVRADHGGPARWRRRWRPSRAARIERWAARTSVGRHPAAAAGATAAALLTFALLRRVLSTAWLDEPLTTAESEVGRDAAEPTDDARARSRPIHHITPAEPIGTATRRTAPNSRPAPTAPAIGGPLPAAAPERPAPAVLTAVETVETSGDDRADARPEAA